MTIEKFQRLRHVGEPFTVVHSWTMQNVTHDRALALWCYLQSMPEDWQVRRVHICEHFGWGRRVWLAAMKTLREDGLVESVPVRDEAGKMAGRELLVYSTMAASRRSDFPRVAKCDRSQNVTGHKARPLTNDTKNTKDIEEKNKRNKEGISLPAVARDNPEAGSPPAATGEDLAGGEASKGVPTNKIVGLYHDVLGQWLPKVAKVTPKRRGQIRQRWIQDMPNLPSWQAYFERVSRCPFLLGQVPGREGQPPFRASIEWLTNETNYTKVIEGKYENQQTPAPQTAWLVR
jgi:hypothetical protein